MNKQWQPIASFDDPDCTVAVFGRKYGYGDPEEIIERTEPEICLLAWASLTGGERLFATTETYHTDSTYYIRPTHWMAIPTPPSPAIQPSHS